MNATSGRETASSSIPASDSDAANSSRNDPGANHGAQQGGAIHGGANHGGARTASVGATTAIDDRSTPLVWIQLGILAWGVVLAFGVSWYDHLHGGFKLQRPLVVLVCTLLFLGGWKLALRSRKIPVSQ